MTTQAKLKPGTLQDPAQRLASLSTIAQPELRAEWRRLYRSEPPKAINRDFLELAIAWKIQAKAGGDLSYATKRRLQNLAETLESKGDFTPQRSRAFKPGAQLIREWHGQTHSVRVIEDGYEFQGRRWQSLTAIAREITGAKWSGPRFFGLSGKAIAEKPGRAVADG